MNKIDVYAKFETEAKDQEEANDNVQHYLDLMRVTGVLIISNPSDKIHLQDARFAIDGAITYGRMGINRPPSETHWLMEYWNMGAELAGTSTSKEDAATIDRRGTNVSNINAKTMNFEDQCANEAHIRAALKGRGL